MNISGQPADAALAAELEDLERALHTPQVRGDRARLSELLDEDFSEIGSSGQCYGRTAALAEIPLERAQVQIESEQYAVSLLTQDLAQVRYRSRYHLDGQPQRLHAVRHGHHLVRRGQQPDDVLAQVGVVVGEQDATGPAG